MDLVDILRLTQDLDLHKFEDRAILRTRITRHYCLTPTANLRERCPSGAATTLRGDALRIIADQIIIDMLARS